MIFMKKLNGNQIESLKNKIEAEIPILGLSFNTPYEKEENGIPYIVLERYNYKMKIIYVIVPLSKEEQFVRISELEVITNKLLNSTDANFGYFGTCSFENDSAVYLYPTDHQIERLK